MLNFKNIKKKLAEIHLWYKPALCIGGNQLITKFLIGTKIKWCRKNENNPIIETKIVPREKKIILNCEFIK